MSKSFKIGKEFEVYEHFDVQTKELVEKALSILEFAKAIGLNPRNSRCKKTDQDCMPSIINSISSLLYTRNRLMNLNPFVNTCILRRGQAKMVAFDRFHKIGICISYTNIMNKLLEIGKEFDAPVKKWIETAGKELSFFRQAINEKILSSQEIPIELKKSTITSKTATSEQKKQTAETTTSETKASETTTLQTKASWTKASETTTSETKALETTI